VKDVGVMKDEDLKLEEIEASHTLGGTTIREISHRIHRPPSNRPPTDGGGFTISGDLKSFQGPVLKCSVSTTH